MKKIFLMTLLLTLFSSVFPQKSAFKPCDLPAYVADRDPLGLNVRSLPDKSGRVLARLVKGESEITVDVIGASGSGWLKITNAWHGDNGDIFKEQGWVFGSMLATGTKGYPDYDAAARLYQTASKKGRILTKIPSESEVILLDCAGSWAKVSYNGTIGWLARENQCGSPFTTCN